MNRRCVNIRYPDGSVPTSDVPDIGPREADCVQEHELSYFDGSDVTTDSINSSDLSTDSSNNTSDFNLD